MEMNINSTLEDYYRRFVDLQEKLKKSEEQRFVLEKKFNDMVLVAKEEEQMHYRRLRSQYKKFLEEDRKRQCRNEQIIRSLEQVETRISTLSAKTERIDDLRKQYQMYLQRMCDHHPRTKMIPPIKRSQSKDRHSYHPDKATQTIDIQSSLLDRPSLAKSYDKDAHNEKLEILDHYLQNLSSQRCKDEVLSEESPLWSKDYQAGTSNQATVIADDIMNSIYSRYYNKSELLPGNTKSDDAVDKTDPREVPDNNHDIFPEYFLLNKKEEKDNFNKTELPLHSGKNDEAGSKKVPDVQAQVPDDDRERNPENVISDETPETSSFKLVESSRGLFDDASNDQPHPVIVNTEKEGDASIVGVTFDQHDQAPTESPPIKDIVIDQVELTNPIDETPHHQVKSQSPADDQSNNPENVTCTTHIEAQQIEPQNNQEQDIQNDQFPNSQDYHPEISIDQDNSQETPPTDPDQTDVELPVQKCDDEHNNPPVEQESVDDIPQPDQNEDHDQSHEDVAEPNPSQEYYDESNQQMEYDQRGVDYEQTLQPDQGQYARYDDQSALYDQEQSVQYEPNGQPVQYDENGQLIDQYNQYQQQAFYDQNGQMIQPQFDESGQMIPQYDENGHSMVVYDQNGQQYFGEQYDESQQQYYNYTEQEQSQFDAEQYDQYQANESHQPDDGNTENVTESPAQPDEVEGVNPEEDVKTTNVMDMLDTDTESVKQNVSKVSNESDFDFS